MGYVFMASGVYTIFFAQWTNTPSALDALLFKLIPTLIGIFLFVTGAAEVGLLDAMREAL